MGINKLLKEREGQKLNEARAQLEALDRDLQSTQQELSVWDDHDLTREDGSGAQDRRHEDRGSKLRDRVDVARRRVEVQQKMVADLAQVTAMEKARNARK